jgi:hypothetical protein
VCTHVVIRFQATGREVRLAGPTVSGTVTIAGTEDEPRHFEGWLRLPSILETLVSRDGDSRCG